MGRRVLGSLAVAVAIATVSPVALAALPKLGTILTGTSAHKRYSFQFYMECFSGSCKRSNTFAFSVQSSHPKGNCTTDSDQLLAPKFKHGKWSTTGEFSGVHGGILKFSATGTSTSTRISGKITGPKSCGGSDTFTAKVAPAASS